MRREIIGFWDGSGISWTICKQSAPRSRQLITSIPHHSIFTARMLFPTPNQQCQRTEGTEEVLLLTIVILHTHTFNGPFSGTTRVGQYQKGKTNLDFTEARDSEWQWHQLGHTHVCTSLQTDNHSSTPPLSFLQAWSPSCHPTNSAKALKASIVILH